jgi:hypothetical protein
MRHDTARLRLLFISIYSQTCVQRPPLEPEKRGRYVVDFMKKISGK